tara:strand:+ start:388 stop:699 length:312 start_codon:yes stop_codon:yes gene_type:complete
MTYTKIELKQKIGPEFFSAIYIKKNGEKRTILGKLHVKDQKFFAGGELLGKRDHLLECIDVNILKKVDDPKKAWRSIQINDLISLKVKGEELVKKGESNAIAA